MQEAQVSHAELAVLLYTLKLAACFNESVEIDNKVVAGTVTLGSYLYETNRNEVLEAWHI